MSSSLSFFSYPSCSCAHTSPLQKQVQSASGHLLFSGGQGLVLFPADILLACSVCSIHTHINTYTKRIYISLCFPYNFPTLSYPLFLQILLYTHFSQYSHLCKHLIPQWLICCYTLFVHFCLDLQKSVFVAHLIDGVTSGCTYTLSPDMLF